MFRSKKELHALWSAIEPAFIRYLPPSITFTETDIVFWPDTYSYIGLELNNTWVFFIFDNNKSNINIYSHHRLPVNIVELAVSIKAVLHNCIVPNTSKKMSKTD